MSEYESDLSQLVYELNRSLPGAKTEPEHKSGIKTERRSSIDTYLMQAAEQNASDIILMAGSAITLRVNGSLTPAIGKVLSAEDLRNLLLPLLTNEQAKELESSRALDFCFVSGSTGRFRANVHYQRRTLAASIRLLPAQIPTIDSLHLPPVLARLIERRQGLILLTGPTGCGKTSTMAALIDLINARRREHIITIEDPETAISNIRMLEPQAQKQTTHRAACRKRGDRTSIGPPSGNLWQDASLPPSCEDDVNVVPGPSRGSPREA